MQTNISFVPVANGDLPGLAKQINQHHAVAIQAAKNAINRAISAGEALIQAKALVCHGEWLPWIKKNLDFSARTAQAYMKIALGRPALDSKCAGSAHLTIDDALKLLAAPRPPEPASAAPDLASGKILYALGEWDTVAQIEPSQKYPGYHYVSYLNVDTGELAETMRPFNLGLVGLDVLGDLLDHLGFMQISEWKACEPADALIPVVSEATKCAAYTKTLTGATWAEAMSAE